ncbi:MAG: hypothetical protein FJ091_21265 [Deltaproteobacteria bacterium]|nr:hypothetical protein [Deltaproteobacteria bacterium]
MRRAAAEGIARRSSWIGYEVGLAVLFAVLLHRSWGTRPDPIIDFGRELYVPWQLGEGRALFSELAWFNGPLSPQWNWLMFEVFGVGLRTLVLVNAVLFALIVATLHRLLRRFSSAFGAFVACCVVLLVCGFGQLVDVGNYNFIAPYSHEMTHGILLGLLATELALSSASVPRLASVSGFLVGLAFLTKPEVFVAALGGAGLGVVLSAPLTRHRAAAFAGGLCLPPLASAALLAASHPPWDALRFTLGGWPELFMTDVSDSPFHRAGMGLDAPVARIREMFVAAAAAAAVMAPGILIARIRKLAAFPRVALAASLSAAALLFLLIAKGAPMLASARVLTLLTLAATLFAAVRLARERTSESVALFAFAAFALAALLKLGLNARVVQYGFALALPALALASVGLVDALPRLLSAKGFDAVAARATALVPLLGFAWFAWATTELAISQKTVRVGSGADTFLADERGRVLAESLDWLEERPPEQARSLVALPEGVMLNYLARIPNPTPYVNFVPGDLPLFGERNVSASLRVARPELLAVVHRDTSEYGSEFFGIDYARDLGDWVRESYVHVRTFGGAPLRRETEFGIEIRAPREPHPGRR